MAETLQELFEHELRDIFDAEHKLVGALESMAKKRPPGEEEDFAVVSDASEEIITLPESEQVIRT
jgi:hypothetical protein